MTFRTLLVRTISSGCAIALMQLSGAARAANLPVCAASDVVLLDGLQYNSHFADHKGVTPLEHAQTALASGGIASIPFGPFDLSKLAPQKVASEVAFLKPRVVVVHYSAFEGHTVGPVNGRLGDFLHQMGLETRGAPPVFVFYSAAFPDRSANKSPKERARIDATTALLAELMQIGAPAFPQRAFFTMVDSNDVRFTTERSKRELAEGVKLGLVACTLS